MTIEEFLEARWTELEFLSRTRLNTAERLAVQAEDVARLYGDVDQPDDVKPADRLWFTAQDAVQFLKFLGPEYVLLDIEAKRKFVTRTGEGYGYDLALRTFAHPYHGHEDFDPEWGIDQPILRNAWPKL